MLLPHLIEVYERTMRETDQIADAPTIELLDDIVRKIRRHVAWGQEVLDRLCDTDAKRERRRARAAALREQLAHVRRRDGRRAPASDRLSDVRSWRRSHRRRADLAQPHVEQLDEQRERHREVDVALRDVLAEAVGDQHHADQDQERQRQHLHASGAARRSR